MDAIRDPRWECVVVMSAAQVGKTEVLNNIVGFHVDQDPCPILVVQPTLDMAETWSKDRLAPMLRDSPCLSGKVRDPASRNSGNTVRHKVFPGGHITMAGANSAASLASRPIRVVLCDEVDRYPPSAGTEGDPVSLARRRAATFWNRKLLLTSTPTIKGISRIESAWRGSTQDRYEVPCHACGSRQALEWAQVKWDEGDPESARYECASCGAHWSDAERWAALRDGEWISKDPGAAVRGFHLSELYSPWSELRQIVAAFLEAKRLPETLRVWVNTALGETYEEQGETVEPHVLYTTRREHYGPTLPERAVLVTCGVDHQKDRLEVETVAWSAEAESWSLRYDVLLGDMTDPAGGAWKDLDDLLETVRFPHESGRELAVSAACIDTHGLYTDEAYVFCKRRWARRVWAVRGMGGHGLPAVVRHSTKNRHRVRLFSLGVDGLKAKLYSRLFEVTETGPGYCHFPHDRDEEYFESLASERAVTRYHRGRATIAWIPKPGTRQEALDCRVYAMAAVEILDPLWTRLRKLYTVDTEAPPEAPPPRPAPPKAPRRRRRSNYVTGDR